MRPRGLGPARAEPALQDKAAQGCIQKGLMRRAPGVRMQERERHSQQSTVLPALPLARGALVLGWGRAGPGQQLRVEPDGAIGAGGEDPGLGGVEEDVEDAQV